MALTRTLLAVLVLALCGCARPEGQAPGEPPADPTPEADPGEMYHDLRAMALGLRAPGASPAAALMELDLGGGSATLVATADGATSLYLSTGGGIIGAGEHAPVREAAAAFLRMAAAQAGLMEAAPDHPLPSAGHVRFYVVTGAGLRTAEAREQALARGDHPLSDLYGAGQEVLTAVRRTSDGR